MSDEQSETPKLKTFEWAMDEVGKIRLTAVAHTGEKMNWFLDHNSLTGFMSFLFDLARQSAEKYAPPEVKTKRITDKPIPVAQMGTGPGEHEREGILTVQTGQFELVFSADAAILLETLRKYEAICRPIEKPKLN